MLPKKTKEEDSKSNSYMRYAGMATTMFIAMYVAFWLGSKLDDYLNNSKAYFGLLFLVCTLGAYLYKLVKDLS